MSVPEEGPLVSVIIVNWNGLPYLKDCLISLLSSAYSRMEIIVSDNASNDGSQKMIEEEFQNVKLIRNQLNLGFSGGNNVAFRSAKGSYFFLLNSDAAIESNCISKLIGAAARDPSIAILGCKIFNSTAGNRVLEHVGGILFPSGYTTNRGYLETDNGQFEEERDVDYVAAAAMMVSRHLVEQIGPFDDLFSLYYEETDLGYRARRAGFKVVVVPSAVAWHIGGATVNRLYDKRAKLKAMERSRVCFVLKSFSLPLLLKFVRHEVSMNASFFLSRRGRAVRGNFVAIGLAYLWAFAHMSLILRHRIEAAAEISRARRSSNE